MNNILLNGSDKQFWHRFVPVYEEKLKQLKKCDTILEFGVFKGESIRWLSSLYPDAKIYGSDILEIQKEWPTSENIKYLHVDQGKLSTIENVFSEIGTKIDLIIEDGSHFPEHQKNCLVESLKHLVSGGIYILEDIHTSHPEHPYYQSQGAPKKWNLGKKKNQNYISPLHLLLCFEHLISNKLLLDGALVEDLAQNSLFNKDQIKSVFTKIETIELYRRATPPHKCYSCNSSEFDYHNLRCKCGKNIYSNFDSMTAVITCK